jgi:hypothetical protein
MAQLDQQSPELALRRQSRILAAVTAAAAAVLVLLIVFSITAALLMPHGGVSPALGARLAYWTPAPFYLWALWAIRRVFREVGAGMAFDSAVARGLTHLGWAIIAGSVASTLALPLLLRLSGEPGLPQSDGGRFQGIAQFDLAYVALGFVGAAILLLSRLLRLAMAYRAENAALKAELSEFL